MKKNIKRECFNCKHCGMDMDMTPYCANPEAWDEYTPLVNPILGQCAVTALIVQDLFGGKLLRGIVNGVSHYWNELPDGSEVDLTINQFKEPIVVGKEERTREYILSFPATLKRYELLKSRIGL